MRLFKILSLVVAAWCSTNAYADDIRLGYPAYGGTGCPQNSASVALSPDQKSVSILFDQYVVEAGGGRRLDRKTCNIAIPVTIPQGWSVSIFEVDYRGFVSIPSGGRAQFNVDYFFAGGNGVRTTKTFASGTSRDYLLTDRLAAEALVWSACGAQTNLRVNTNMLVQSNYRGDQALATVDSADIQAGIVYHLQWRRCH